MDAVAVVAAAPSRRRLPTVYRHKSSLEPAFDAQHAALSSGSPTGMRQELVNMQQASAR